MITLIGDIHARWGLVSGQTALPTHPLESFTGDVMHQYQIMIKHADGREKARGPKIPDCKSAFPTGGSKGGIRPKGHIYVTRLGL